MTISFDDRPSDSPLVDRVWRSHSEGGGSFTSMAASHCLLVVTKRHGTITMELQGPETKATPALYPADGEWLGIQLKLGAFMPRFPVHQLVDDAVFFPPATGQSFWLDGSAWQFPDYENADTFVDRLARRGLLVYEPVVDTVLYRRPHHLSLRSMQRHFLQATGLSRSAALLINRARHATVLLQQGASVHDAVYAAGYADQSHLIRSLRRFIGQTPTRLVAQSEALSFLFYTTPPDLG